LVGGISALSPTFAEGQSSRQQELRKQHTQPCTTHLHERKSPELAMPDVVNGGAEEEL